MAGTQRFGDAEESADDTVRRALEQGRTAQRSPSQGSARLFSQPLEGADSPFGASPGSERSHAPPPFADMAFTASALPQPGFGQVRLGGVTDGLGATGSLADLASVLSSAANERSRADSLTPSARRADEFIGNVFSTAALNPLVGVASPLLWLAARLNESAAPEDLRLFRDRIVEEIRRFESAALAKGLPNRSVLVTRYALCATIDDIILNTAWAGQAQWATRSLVSLLYGETWGGERFYELLQQLVPSPDENIDVLELLAICLSIGFVGKYRVMEDGSSSLMRLRAELYRVIRRVRGSYERDLAPAWSGVDAPYKAAPSAWRFWAPPLSALLLLAAFYLVLRLSLAYRVDAAAQRIAALVPSEPPATAKVAIPTLPTPSAARLTQVQRITAVLQQQIADKRVEVVGTPTTVIVRLPASSFPSGAATLPQDQAPLLERIAAALNPERGGILVTGYTDNVRPQPGNAIKTNYDLSKARAASVAAMLTPYLGNKGRVTTTGRGEDDPIASNGTADGRARNRRVEIQIPAEDTVRTPLPAPVTAGSSNATPQP